MNRRDLIKSVGATALAASTLPVWARRGRGGVSAIAPHDLIMNLGAFGYADPELPFLNVLKQAGSNANWSAWSTWNASGAETNEEAYLIQILDANGYPTTLTLPTPPSGGQVFTQLQTGAFINIGTGPGATSLYPADTYRFQWQGKGSIKFSGDVTALASASAGCTISGTTVTSTNAWGTTNTVTLQGSGAGGILTPSAGIKYIIPPSGITDSANYPKAFTCVQSTYTSLFDGGQIFHPTFLAWLQTVPWKSLRFMDWLETNGQVGQARYQGYSFSTPPTAGSALPALAAAWPNQTGQRRVTLATGEELQVTFTTGSTAVTSTSNPTITASSGTVPSFESTTDFFWFAYDSWAGRAQLGDLCYTTNRGVPYEILIDLCNILSCDPWLNVPPQFQTADWASFASLVTSNLNAGRKARIELSNEVWNSGTFITYHLFNCKSIKLWGAADVGSYLGMAVAQMADQLASTAGNPGFDNSFIVTLCGQAANTGWLTTSLTTPSWAGNTPPWQRTSASGQKTIKAVGIAPYIAGGAIYAADFTHMTGEGDGGYSDFFATFTTNPVGGYTYHDSGGTALPSGGWFAIASGWVTSTISAIAPYGALPICCYEGSWQFYNSGSAGQATFLTAAARDARMASLQQLYYRSMASAGATPCQYSFCNAYGTYQWGLIETVMQVETPLASTPARWQGAVNYVNQG